MKQHLVAIKDSTIGWVAGVLMPLRPPLGTCITGRVVSGVMAEEMNVEPPSGVTVGRVGVMEAAFEIHSDEVPSWSECTLWQVLNKEHVVGAGDDRIIEL